MATPAQPSGKMRDALRAAHLYYMQDLTMEAIARELNTSRSSVSRRTGRSTRAPAASARPPTC